MSPRTKTPEVTMLPVDSLSPSGLNPRLDVGDVTELADSIRALGILVPLLVAPFGEGYVVIAGHRRLKAAKLVKMVDVPAIVREASELERLELMIVENQQRVPLTPVEEGITYARILKNHPVTQVQLAKDLGVSEWYVSTRLAILNLSKKVVEQIHRGELSVSVALGYRDDGTGRAARTPNKTQRAPRSSCIIDVHRGHSPVRCEIAAAAGRGAA